MRTQEGPEGRREVIILFPNCPPLVMLLRDGNTLEFAHLSLIGALVEGKHIFLMNLASIATITYIFRLFIEIYFKVIRA